MLECVPNVSEGRNTPLLATLAEMCGASLLDLHSDADHNRSVFTLAGPGPRDAIDALHSLAYGVRANLDIESHLGVHPRLGALDVVPFVALDDGPEVAVEAALETAAWLVARLGIPVFLYGDADPARRSLPETRRAAFSSRPPDLGPTTPDPRFGAVAVGARPPLVAVNCWLDTTDVALARRIATAIRERDGGLPGVRAMGFELARARATQVSMNLVDLDRTGLEAACTDVRRRAEEGGSHVTRVELVGLLPAAELTRCSQAFLDWTGLGPDVTIESRLASR